MFENLNLGTETLVLLGLGAGGFMFGPKKGGMASLAKLASIGLLGLGVGNATGVFTVARLKGMIGLNGTAAGAFATDADYLRYQILNYTLGQGQQQYYPYQYYQYQQQQPQYYDPYQYQYQQYQQQPYSYSNYYPSYYPTGQQQYYYPQQQYQSYPYQYPTYQYQQQTYSPLSTCIQTCQQMYQY